MTGDETRRHGRRTPQPPSAGPPAGAGRPRDARELLDDAAPLFEQARLLDAGARAAFVAARTPDDAELRVELLRLLAHADAPGLATSANEGVARAAAAAMSEELPSHIGRYRVLGILGQGGMGTVYEVIDERLHRRVALKTLMREMASDPEARERLEREARTAASLSHPGIVTVHSVEESGGALYMTLELVAGRTLSEHVPDGGLAEATLLDWALQITDAVAAAHAAGIVHRDLKPSNIMVTPAGRLKVLDFGIARIHGSTADDLTEAGLVIGTPAYMSPEQVEGKVAGPASDTWALGVVLHQMATGIPPFRGDTPAALAAAILRDAPPPLSALRRDLPSGLGEIVARCLHEDASRRYASATELHAELRALLGGTSLPAQGDARHRGSQSLPVEQDAFVGRDAEQAELTHLLDGGHRLVSVLGLGGTGKTRLVVHHAVKNAGRFPGGAWFCDLSDARTPDALLLAVATALEVPLSAADAVAQLGQAIAGRGECLVILDNFEQVARHAQATLGRWLARCPEARFVVTSREVLGVPGEQALLLQPLPQAEGEALFMTRAKAARNDFAPDTSEISHVAELVRLLDGLPLAIELAAARVRIMPPSKLISRIGKRFELLSSAGRRRDRQATLRATLDWSWDLLADWEKAALAQVSAFQGEFTLESAEAVLDLSSWAGAPLAMDAVQALVDKSLIRTTQGYRFDLLVSVQEYAAEKLSTEGAIPAGGSGAAAELAAWARHAEHFARSGGARELSELNDAEGPDRRRHLVRAVPDLVTACRRSLAAGAVTRATAILKAAWAVLDVNGPLQLAAALAEEVAAKAGPGSAERATVLVIRGRALQLDGRHDEALLNLEEARAIHRSLGDAVGEARMLRHLATLHREHGRTDEALAALTEARDLSVRAVDPATLAFTQASLGILLQYRGELDAGALELESAVAAFHAQGNEYQEGISCGNLGLLRTEQGRLEEAQPLLVRALEVHRRFANRRIEAVTLNNLGTLSRKLGRLDEAREHYAAALLIQRSIGIRGSQGNILGNVGLVLLAEGRLEEAREQLVAGVAILREAGWSQFEGIVLGSLGRVHGAAGRLEEARAAFAEAESRLVEANDRRSVAEVLCFRAECEASSNADGARADLARAATLADAVGAGTDSELRHLLARVQALVPPALSA